MGKLTNFEICFDNPNGIYYSGCFVEGSVSIDLSSPMKMKRLHIKFKGKTEVEWTHQQHDDEQSRVYKAEEKYFEKDILLFGNVPSENYCSVELDTGHHDLPFRFQLPPGLPSSFEATGGRVEYKATARIVRMDKGDKETHRQFTVIGLLDLNLKPEYRSGISGSNQKHLCCCCCKSGPISAQFYVERQGWIPGEAIRLYADIKNEASRTIDKSYVNLTMKTILHAQSNTKEEKKVVACVTRPPIRGHSEDSWTGEFLFIPSLPPTHLGAAGRLIDVQYILELIVEPSGPSLYLSVPLSIVIGTIPLSVVDQPPTFMGTGHAPVSSMLPPGHGPSAPPLPMDSHFHNQPPPSYVESMMASGGEVAGNGERTHLNTSRSFTPSYTFYNNWGDGQPALPVYQQENQPMLKGKD